MSTADKVIDFQQSVGIAYSNFNLIVAYIFAFICCVGAIGMTLRGLAKTKDWDCMEGPGSDLLPDEKEKCREKQHPQYLWALALVPFSLLLVWLAHWSKNMSQKNKAFGAVQGTLGEAELVSSLFR